MTNKEAVDTIRYVDTVTSFDLLEEGPKPFSSTRRLDLASSFLVESVSTGYDMAADDGGMVALTFPQNGSVIREIANRQIAAVTGEFQLLLPSVRKTMIRSANGRPFRALSYFAPMRSLRKHLIPGSSFPPAESRTLTLSGELAAGAAIASIVRNFCGRLTDQRRWADPDKARALFELFLAELLADLLSTRAKQTSHTPASQRTVDIVEEMMWAEHTEPIAIADLARAAGVGIRSLQLAFLGHRGKSPKATLSEIRLSRARALLIAAGQNASVTDVAMACGIAHLGRFSLAYRKIYGETPSQTLSKVRSL